MDLERDVAPMAISSADDDETELTEASAARSARRGEVGTTMVNSTTQTATQESPRNPWCTSRPARVAELGRGDGVAAHDLEDEAEGHRAGRRDAPDHRREQHRDDDADDARRPLDDVSQEARPLVRE